MGIIKRQDLRRKKKPSIRVNLVSGRINEFVSSYWNAAKYSPADVCPIHGYRVELLERRDEGVLHGVDRPGHELFMRRAEVQVIGNIHENPDLV